MAGRGVIVDFDFAVANGAEILFETAKEFLKKLDGIKLDESLEARYLAGNGYEDGFGRFFAAVKTKKTAQKAAREFAAAFVRQLTDAAPSSVGPAARNFIKALVEKGIKLVIVSRADPEAVKAAPVENWSCLMWTRTVTLPTAVPCPCSMEIPSRTPQQP